MLFICSSLSQGIPLDAAPILLYDGMFADILQMAACTGARCWVRAMISATVYRSDIACTRHLTGHAAAASLVGRCLPLQEAFEYWPIRTSAIEKWASTSSLRYDNYHGALDIQAFAIPKFTQERQFHVSYLA